MTVTGDIHVLRKEHFERMKDGAIVCNSGHFNVEVDISALEAMKNREEEAAALPRRIHADRTARRSILLGEGRLINLAAAEGHPSEVMDMSFANQSLVRRIRVEEGQGASKRRSTACPWR